MSAGLQTTQPLALGLNLEVGPTSLTAQGFSVPVSVGDADLSTAAGGADIGTSWPVVLGLLTGTSGVVGYSLTAEAASVLVTVRDAVLTLEPLPADTIDVAVVWPTALALLLGPSGFTLVAEAFNVGVNFAPSEASMEVLPDAALQTLGGQVKRRKVPAAVAEQMLMEDLMAALVPMFDEGRFNG